MRKRLARADGISNDFSSSAQLGQRIASVLRRVWHRPPPPMRLSSDHFAEVIPALLGTGAGALGWWRLLHADATEWSGAHELQQAYRLHSIQAAVHEQRIARVFQRLRTAGIEPLLIKGWAVARLYPEKGLRPYGDIDICVKPEHYVAAVAVLQELQSFVDLHSGCRFLDDHHIDDLYAHSRLVRLGDLNVRILGPEDHLRLLCLHCLGHGAWRPLWLCDIAVALESRPLDFDWDRFLVGDQRRSEGATCALGLAGVLLDARLDDTPIADLAARLPRWLVPSVLSQWGTTSRWPSRPLVMFALAAHPTRAFSELRRRWPDPIRATVHWRAPFNDLPRFPFQLAELISGLRVIPRQIGWLLAGRRRATTHSSQDGAGENHDIPRPCTPA